METIQLMANMVGKTIEYYDENDDVHFRVNLKDVLNYVGSINTDGEFEEGYFEERDENDGFSYTKCETFEKYQSDEEYLDEHFEEITEQFLNEIIIKNQ